MSKFYLSLQYVTPYQVTSLTISSMDETPGQLRLFLSLFSIKQFIRLESLQLFQPSNSMYFNRILSELHTLEFLKSLSIIHCHPSSVNHDTVLLFASFLNSSISLRRLYITGALNAIFHSHIASSVDHLYFNNNIFNTIPLENIASRMTHLKSLETAITLDVDYKHLPSFIHLTRLTITIFIYMNNSDLKVLLSKMSSLVFLTIIGNGKQWFNGHFWEGCLPSTVQKFQFTFSTQSVHISDQCVLETFQTPFWLDVKHWYVMLDSQMNPTMIHLYSLPYCEKQFYYRPSMVSDKKFRSSIPIHKPYLNHVKKLTLDLTTLIKEPHTSLSSIHHFSNVSTLIIIDHGNYSSVPLIINFLDSTINFTYITELKLGQCHHSDFIRVLYNYLPRLYSLGIAETMLTELQMLDFGNIRSLNICDCLLNVDTTISMFPTLESLCTRVVKYEHMQQVIELLKNTLVNVTFRHVSLELQEKTLEWLHGYCEKHRQISYDMDEHMNLHIWLGDRL